ncbi:MAG: transketolase C-terminal domain-containing protein [Candidatus Woesearchaeota archaeon]
MRIRKALSGAHAVAEAMRQINPDVVAVYPITPQTPIAMKFSEFVNDGLVDTEMIRVESEHSAMSACIGSAASGARTMTATSANGLALMVEIVYIASSLRLPIVMNLVNRALSGPINIHGDHSDAMLVRDSGWIMLASVNAQDVYDNTIMAVRIGEHKEVMLPVMVLQDGFITSHSVETLYTLDDQTVKNFIGEYKPKYNLLNTEKPITIGPLDLFDYYFEHKRQQAEAMEKSKIVIKRIFEEFSKISGRKYDYFEGYKTSDADFIILTMNSSVGTAMEVADRFRDKGVKAGVLSVRVFRPFMNEEVVKKLKNAKVVAILDRAIAFGSYGGVLFNDVRSAFYEQPKKPKIINYIYGLGGRELTEEMIKKVFDDMIKLNKGKKIKQVQYLGVRD